MKGLVVICVVAILGTARSQAVNGNWGSWSGYGACSVTCGNGLQTRTRACDNPPPSGGGSDCSGDSSESTACYEGTCYPSVLGNLERNCSWTYFGCYSGSMTCIDFSFRCDGNSDCDDGSDESSSIAGCSVACNGAGTISISSYLMTTVVAFISVTYRIMLTKD